MTTRTHHRSIVALLTVLAFVVGACGDDSDSSSGTTDQPFISTGVANCDDADIGDAVPPGGTLDSYECDAGWAAITYTDADGNQETIAAQAEGQFWVPMPCDAEDIPASIAEKACP